MAIRENQVNLRAERLNRGLSIRAAADEIGVGRQTLLRAESGKYVPVPSSAFLIAQFYGYQVTDVWPVEPANGQAS